MGCSDSNSVKTNENKNNRVISYNNNNIQNNLNKVNYPNNQYNPNNINNQYNQNNTNNQYNQNNINNNQYNQNNINNNQYNINNNQYNQNNQINPNNINYQFNQNNINNVNDVNDQNNIITVNNQNIPSNVNFQFNNNDPNNNVVFKVQFYNNKDDIDDMDDMDDMNEQMDANDFMNDFFNKMNNKRKMFINNMNNPNSNFVQGFHFTSNITSNIKINNNFKIAGNNNSNQTEDLEKLITLDSNYSYTYFQKQCLSQHNKYRKNHHVGDLQLSNELCEISQKYADYIASKEYFEHSHTKFKSYYMGENLYRCSGFKPDGTTAVDSWYEEKEDYDFENGKSRNGGVIGHLTAMLWKESKYLGVGIAKGDEYYYVVCNYFPGGNIRGEYTDNVFPE